MGKASIKAERYAHRHRWRDIDRDTGKAAADSGIVINFVIGPTGKKKQICIFCHKTRHVDI